MRSLQCRKTKAAIRSTPSGTSARTVFAGFLAARADNIRRHEDMAMGYGREGEGMKAWDYGGEGEGIKAWGYGEA